MLGTDLSHEALQTIDGHNVDWAMRNLFPYGRFQAAISCPACWCLKSGDAQEPNKPQECCQGDCKCHYECEHTTTESENIADGVIAGGASTVIASICTDCGADVTELVDQRASIAATLDGWTEAEMREVYGR